MKYIIITMTKYVKDPYTENNKNNADRNQRHK